MLILLAGAFYIACGDISLFVFLTFLILGLRIYEPIKALGAVYEITKSAEITIDRIESLLFAAKVTEGSDNTLPDTFDIAFENVSFSYKKKKILDAVSFHIPHNKATVIVGPSGAGKTTILRLIARLWDADSGCIRIGSKDIKSLTIQALYKQVSIVFQDVYLFNATIFENIAFGREHVSSTAVINAAKAAQCHDFISTLPQGYNTIIGEKGSNLSGGERQRISIARAILKDAPIILLDEATASVDSENEHLIQKAFNELVHSKTVVTIAHRLATVTKADQIIVLDGKGRIEATGRHEELLQTSSTYKKFWESRNQSLSWTVSQ